MKRYLAESGKKIVLADGDLGDIKAFDGGMEKDLHILKKSNDADVMNKICTKYGHWHTL